MKVRMRRTTIVLAFFAASLLLSLNGCGGIHKPFVPLAPLNIRPPATLAVISGGVDEATVNLADYLTAELAARTRFQEKISRLAGNTLKGYGEQIPPKEIDNQVNTGIVRQLIAFARSGCFATCFHYCCSGSITIQYGGPNVPN